MMKRNLLYNTTENDRSSINNIQKFNGITENYYPINTAIVINSTSDEIVTQLAVTVDRSHGGTSLRNGTIEIMQQRRLMTDD